MYCHHQWNDEGNVTFFINHLTTFQMKMLQFFSIFNLKIKIEGSLLNSWNGNVQIIRYSEKKKDILLLEYASVVESPGKTGSCVRIIDAYKGQKHFAICKCEKLRKCCRTMRSRLHSSSPQ